MTDRRTVTVPKSWAWSVLVGGFMVVGVLVMVGLTLLRSSERDRERDKAHAATTADVRLLAADAKAISGATKAILEDQRRRDLERQPAIDAAIKRIIGDNAEAHAALLGEIARLLNRPVPTVRTASPAPPVATPTTTTTMAPQPSPTTTTTTTCVPHKRQRCR